MQASSVLHGKGGLLQEFALLDICGIAFAVVFGLLTLLAITIHVITLVFPASESTEREPASLPQGKQPPRETQPEVDLAVVAAISTAVATMIPGARVTRVEEKRS